MLQVENAEGQTPAMGPDGEVSKCRSLNEDCRDKDMVQEHNDKHLDFITTRKQSGFAVKNIYRARVVLNYK